MALLLRFYSIYSRYMIKAITTSNSNFNWKPKFEKECYINNHAYMRVLKRAMKEYKKF